MKKRIIPIITCLIVLLLFSSCDGSLTQNLNKFLNIANGNVFINSGMIKVDVSAINDVVSSITKVETTKEETVGDTTTRSSGETQLEIDKNNEKANISVGDIKIEVDKEDVESVKSFAPPMTESELDSLNAKLNGIVSSEKKSEELVKQLAEPVEKNSEEEKATKGTFTLTAAVAKKAAENKSSTEEQKVLLNSLAEMATKSAAAESTTAADVLTAKLIMGVVTQISKVSTTEDVTAKAEATKSIIDQASTLITISKKQIGSFDILKLDGFNSILDAMNGKSLSSRDTVENIVIYKFEDADIRKNVSTYRPMIYSALVNLYSFNGQSFDATKEQVLVNSYKTYYNATLALLNYADEDTIEKLEIDDLLKMATSVVVMQLDGVNTKVLGFDSISKLLNDLFTLNPWILKDSNGKFQTITNSDAVKLPKYLDGIVDGIKQTTKPSDFINDTSGIINYTNLYAQLNTLDSMMEKAKIKISTVADFKLTNELDKILGKAVTEK